MTSCEPNHLLKLLLVGDAGAGKSSIAHRYISDEFVANYRPTIGIDFVVKTIHLDRYGPVKLQIWDTAGQEQFASITTMFYRRAHGVLVVYDVNDSKGLESARAWKRQIDEHTKDQDGNPVPAMLLANKCDVNPDVQAPTNDAREMQFLGGALVSAKRNIGIEDSIKLLVTHILKLDEARKNRLPPLPPPTPVPFNWDIAKKTESSSCNC